MMNREKYRQLCSVLHLGSDALPRSMWEFDSAPEVQYSTTNYVVKVGAFVAKQYINDESRKVESSILKARRSFGFRMPELIFSHQSDTLGSWNILERIDGETLASEQPQGQKLYQAIECMISALVEFEQRSSALIPVPQLRWRWETSIGPLISRLRDDGAHDPASVLSAVARAADHALEGFDVVPCFDLFARNIIWSAGRNGAELTFVDFDKAARLVPIGEQLSHIAIFPGLREGLGQAVAHYASISNQSIERIRCLVDVACFFRALSGIRDSLPREFFGNDEVWYDLHAQERHTVLRHSVNQAIGYIPAFCDRISIGAANERALYHILPRLAAWKSE